MAKTWRSGDGLHVDVRGLPAPQPTVTILTFVDALAEPTLIAHLDGDPMPLWPCLAERGWLAHRVAGDTGEVRLLLQRAG